ncbi:putative nuclease HARBI1 [Saccostrea cucullata]|uniref:putative nuclease HARBI1 n=1 Tax=Saccostrea cuccullata TaxID=36930 RepID=UPI002ED3F179
MAYMFALYDNFMKLTILRIFGFLEIQLYAISAILRRKHLPRFVGFFEETIPHFTTEDFKHHFRLSKGMFEEILARISPRLVIVEHVGGIEETPPSYNHIHLSSGPGGDLDYINRKSFPSMQLQVVCDDTLLIRNIYTDWPGSTHDSRVLRNSELFTQAEAGNLSDRNKIILADSAYPLKRWLITPFRDNGRLGANQRRFNRILSLARQSIERCIWRLKGRFRRLHEIPIHKPEDIGSLNSSGCILHNLCILHEDDVDDFIKVDDIGHPNNYPNIFRNDSYGINRRLAIMASLP